MGWSKYAEDNYEIWCERLALKEDGYNVTTQCDVPTLTESNK